MWIYIALFRSTSHSRHSGIYITHFYLQFTPYLPLPRKHSPDGATIDLTCDGVHLIAAYYSSRNPKRMKG